MNDLVLILILILLGAASIFDIRFHRIPNILVFALMVAGLTNQAMLLGSHGLFIALAGALVGGLLFLPFYVIAAMGAGDVKLMSAVGALLGPWQVLQAAVASVIIGGVMAMTVVLLSGQARAFFSRYELMAKTIIRTGHFIFLPRTADHPASQRFAYAAAIAGGTLFVLYQQRAFDILVQS